MKKTFLSVLGIAALIAAGFMIDGKQIMAGTASAVTPVPSAISSTAIDSASLSASLKSTLQAPAAGPTNRSLKVAATCLDTGCQVAGQKYCPGANVCCPAGNYFCSSDRLCHLGSDVLSCTGTKYGCCP
jgi:hypothetical protein